MQRTFHSHISYQHYALLAVLLLAVVCLYWTALPRAVTGLMLGLLLFFMVVVISKATTTTYVIHTDKGILQIHRGRFTRDITIPIDHIRRIDKIRRGALVIVLNDKTEHLVTPHNETDFIRCIEKYHS